MNERAHETEDGGPFRSPTMVVKAFVNRASNWLHRFDTGRPSLEYNLARITDSGLVHVPHIPEELLTIVIEESHVEHGRQVIMAHLRQRLADFTKREAWKRLHASMILIEELMYKGSLTLVSETAAGLYFDVVQKLSLLERFQHTSNKHAQSMIQSKAKVLRNRLVYLFQVFDAKVDEKGVLDSETESTCSFQRSVAETICSFDSSVTCMEFIEYVKYIEDLEDTEYVYSILKRNVESIPSYSGAKPSYEYDFENLVEWAEATCEDSGSDSCCE